jgi:actinorhodin biosynthesis protein ActVIA
VSIPTLTTTTTSFTDLYVQVQQFYAGQVRHLDAVRVEEFAATFTEHGRFYHDPGEPPLEGRRAIAEKVRGYNKLLNVDGPCQRRHWFNMLQVFPQDDGTVVTEHYALVMLSRPGERVPVIAPSCFTRDVLVFENGELLTRERKVVPDYAV